MNSSVYSSTNDLVTYRNVCDRLQKLGYKHPLSPGSIPLLEDLSKDVMFLKEENERYKDVIKNTEKEKRKLRKGLIPYQNDNGRLILKNSDLQGELLEIKDKHEEDQREYKRKIREKDNKIADLEFLYRITLNRVKELEKQFKNKNNKSPKTNLIPLDCQQRNDPVKTISTYHTLPKEKISSPVVHTDNLEKPKNELSHDVVNKFVEMERKTAELLEELEELKLDNQHQSDVIAALKCQLTQKDREICRLRHALEGGRPLSAVTRDCCYQCVQKEHKIKELEEQLEETVTKQHEAMNRALQLAERNQHLERELKDIDNMALAVEKECQNKVRNNLKNMDVMEEKLRKKCEEVKKLEETILNMKNRLERNEMELENLTKEKQLLEKNLHAATGEKKHLNDKINYFLLIEKNLNSEITRMQEINKSLQRQICDMEERVMDVLGTTCKRQTVGKQKKHNPSLSLPSSKTCATSNSNLGLARPGKGDKIHCGEDHKFDHCFHTTSSISFLDKIQQERDFYHNECHRLKDQLGNLTASCDNNSDLMRQIKELEGELIDLKQDNFTLRRENSTILKRLECGEHLSCSSGDSIKIILDRLEKERDMALSDISRLQGERDALKERIKLATESQVSEQSRFEKIIRENEERIRRLESERRELISSQSSQRLKLGDMEEKCDEYKEVARKAQSELAQMKANYNQLKTLQEQTDRSLSEVQSRHSQADVELRVLTTKFQDLEKINTGLEHEISLLKKEKTNLMANLTVIEKDKDGLLITLDEKTEKVAKLEAQIKKQEAHVGDLNEQISHLEKKFEFTLNEKTSREYGFRSLEREVEQLKEELQQHELQKEALIRENRRLQDDLASAAKDCVTARRELDAEKQDVENLKKQLQQYVSEVKKAEELLSMKESERNQMLEHFRSLSIEATTLESNNHTLESTVENTRTQLITAKNRIMDLEHQIASKDGLIHSYEKQIAELTCQIAELETKLKQQMELRILAENDLSALRDLCSTLDGQKEALKLQANDSSAERVHLANEVRRLSEEYDGISQKLTHEQDISRSLEKSLTNSRRDTFEQKMMNKELQSQVQILRQKVDELTQNLETESQDVRRYQAQCAELSLQVSELRREVTNARFEQAKASEDSRRCSALKAESEEDYPCSLASSFRSLPASTRTFTRSPSDTKRVDFSSEIFVPDRYSSSGANERERHLTVLENRSFRSDVFRRTLELHNSSVPGFSYENPETSNERIG